MITVGPYVLNPRYVVGYQWKGDAELEIYLSHTIFPNGKTTITYSGDSPSDIASLVERIEDEINAGASSPR